MLKRILPVLGILSALLLFGCTKTETVAPTNNAEPVKKAAASPAATTTASADKVGVPECDDFIAKYDACISDKVPEAARAQFKTAVQQWRSSWRQAAATPQGKAGLAAACKQAAEQARTSMKAYNCTF
jgi:hypothetical protein